MRKAIIIFGALLLAGGLLAGLLGAPFPAMLPAVGAGAVILLGTLAERLRYKDAGAAPRGPGWRASGERFVDPESGDLVAVWHHDDSGERRYVRLGVGPGLPAEASTSR